MAYNYNPAGSFDTDGNAKDVFISGSTAYVADGDKGLQIIDVSDPENPSLLGTAISNDPGTASSVYVSGNYAYVADGDKGLQIFDVSDPTNPSFVKTYPENNEVVNYQKLSDLSALNSTIYGGLLPDSLLAVYDSEAQNWDVLDLDDPSSISSFSNISFPSALSTSKDAYISGNYTFVADGESGLKIVSIDDVINSTLFGLPIAVTPYDTAGTATDVSVSGNFAYVADTTGLQIIDVSDPTNPTKAYAYETNNETLGVSVDGDYVYVADGEAGLQVLKKIDESTDKDSLADSSNSNKELILGNSGADNLKGLGGADVLAGGGGNDQLLGGGGADTMEGGMGDDTLTGGVGKDVLIGGDGSDVLIGVNPDEADPGKGEKDVLEGNAGADTFVLGDENNIFYHDNGSTNAHGNVSRATITDFTIGEDIIQLNRNGTYKLVESNGSTRIYETSGDARDYIAIVSGVTGLNLADTTQFNTVGSIL